MFDLFEVEIYPNRERYRCDKNCYGFWLVSEVKFEHVQAKTYIIIMNLSLESTKLNGDGRKLISNYSVSKS